MTSRRSRFSIGRVACAFALAVTAGCGSHARAPEIGRITKIEPFCAPREARPTSIASVLTTVGDAVSEKFPSVAGIRRDLKAHGGAIGFFHEQRLALPTLASRFGETDGFVRVDAIAIPTASAADLAAATPSRPVYLEVVDHGVPRWIGATAYDVQDVCVEGAPQA